MDEKNNFPTNQCQDVSKRDGPFRVIQNINNNAYKIKLRYTYEVSVTFNVAELSPYFEGLEDSRMSLFLTWGE